MLSDKGLQTETKEITFICGLHFLKHMATHVFRAKRGKFSEIHSFHLQNHTSEKISQNPGGGVKYLDNYGKLGFVTKDSFYGHKNTWLTAMH